MSSVVLGTPDIFLSAESGVCEDACTATLTTLYDVLKTNALAYARITQEIEFLHQDLKAEPAKGSSEQLLAPELGAKLLAGMKKIDASCTELNLIQTRKKLAYLLRLYEYSPPIETYERAKKDLEHLRLDLMNELQMVTILRLVRGRQQFFVGEKPDAMPFGQAVFEAFPSAAMDVREASNAYALERWPACVFHLMRVLEFGLRSMAAKFEVPYEKAVWHNIIEGIEGKIRRIDANTSGPDWPQQKKDYSDAATQLMFFKEAWRNHVMHIRDVYDTGRATSIWQHVNEFMNKLAAIGLREPED